MSLAVYKIMHYFGLAFVLASLGAVTGHALRGADEPHPKKGLLAAGHGIGMVLMLVAGFGMLARLGGAMMPSWVIPKLIIWLLLGAAFSVAKRAPKAAMLLWLLLPVLVATAAAFALYKPGA